MKMRIGSTHANGTVLCIQPKAPKINDGKDYDLSAMYVLFFDSLLGKSHARGMAYVTLHVDWE
jgi:hypothetical protein